jgi:FkbM family methyltransferase
MITFQAKELIPPIYFRIKNQLLKKGILPKSKSNLEKNLLFPYGEIPFNKNIKWVLDIGANIGNLTENALISYPNANVVCFEPVKATYEILSKNLAKYGDRVYLNNFALADIDGTSEINLTGFHGANSLAKQSEFHKILNPTIREKSTETVIIKRLDDLRDELPSRFFDIVKIDVEGFELNVLKGGLEFFKTSVDTIIIEICMMRDSSVGEQSIFEIFSLLNSCGFYLYNIFDLNYIESNVGPFKLVQMDCVFKKSK